MTALLTLIRSVDQSSLGQLIMNILIGVLWTNKQSGLKTIRLQLPTPRNEDLGYTLGQTITIYSARIRRTAVTHMAAPYRHGSPASWIDVNSMVEDRLKQALGHEIGHAVGLSHMWDCSSDGIVIHGSVPQITEKDKTELSDLDFENNTDPYIDLRMYNPGWIGLYAFDNRITPIASIKKRVAAYNAWIVQNNNALAARQAIIDAHNKAVGEGNPTQTQAEVEAAADTAYNNYTNQLAYKQAIQKRKLYWEKPLGHDFYKLRLHSYNRGVDGLDPNGSGPFTYTYGDTIMDYNYILTSEAENQGAEGIYVAPVFPAFHNWEYNLGVPQNRVQPGWSSRANPKPIPCDGQEVVQPPPPNGGSQNTPPDAPYGLNASFGDGQVTLSWTDGGGTVTGYEYMYRESGGSWGSWIPTESSDTFVDVLELTNGIAYEFLVRALNGESASAASNSFEETPATVPGPPTNLSGYGYNGWISLSWRAPSDDGGAAITDYEYQYSRTYQTYSAWTSWSSTNSLNSVFGLTNGTQYQFQVRAVNRAGVSLASNPAYAMPATTPGVPQNFETTAGDGEVSLSWDAPYSNGGSTITDYEYSYRVGSSGYFDPWVSAGTDQSETVTGLTNGTLYNFRARAVNSVGASPTTGPYSATPEAPISTPGPPTSLTVTAAINGIVIFTWDVPSDDGGAPIEGYEYQYREEGTSTWSSVTSVTYRAGLITGLTNGTTYEIQVWAVNSVGSGTISDILLATPQFPVGSPGSPQNLVATAGDGQVTLSWDAPSLNGGGAITDYEYRRDTYDDDTWTYWSSTGNGSSTSMTLTGLTNGTVYAFKVRAVNSSGSGPESSKVTVTPQAPTVPGAPTNLRASTHSTIVGAVYLSWDAPSDDGGTAITGYEARYRRYYSSGWTAWTSWFPTVWTYTFVTVTERTGGELYGFQVRAVNSEGEGEGSNVATAIAKE